MLIETEEQLNKAIKNVKDSQEIYSTFSQKQVDKIFKYCATGILKDKKLLAEMAVEETNVGNVKDKIIKNEFATKYIYNQYKNMKTCDIIERDSKNKIIKIAKPLGVVAGIIPTTNPTSTAIFKALLCLKTRNGLIVSPHPRAKKSTVETLKRILDLAIKAGAPKNIIAWIDNPTVELSSALMRNNNISVILATGGGAMVKSAYSSGNPAIGVGSGNTAVVIDETADVKNAVKYIVSSKSFDNGVICASEQSLLVVNEIYDKVIEEFKKNGCYLLDNKEKNKLKDTIFLKGKINPAIVGKSAIKISETIGIKVPKETKVLLVQDDKISADNPFSCEKLSPILTIYKVKDFNSAVEKARNIIEIGGMGHTSVIYTSKKNKDRIEKFALTIPTCRILVNTPASFGAIGGMCNALIPSMTLGCGSWGNNSIDENISARHLLNIISVAEMTKKF